MSNNSIQLTSNTIRTTKVSEIKLQPEISLDEKRSIFTQDINNLGNQAIKENWCSDYLTDRISNYAADHAESAQALRFNRQVLKTTADNFLGEKRDCTNPDEGPTFFECLSENKGKLVKDATDCGVAVATAALAKVSRSKSQGAAILNAVSQCSDVVVDILNCIQPTKK